MAGCMYSRRVHTDCVNPKRVRRASAVASPRQGRDAGMTLVELMVAFMIISVAVTAMLFVVTSGMKNQVLTERSDRATGTTQVIISKARQVDFVNLGFYAGDYLPAGPPAGAAVLPINAVGATGIVGAALNEARVDLGADPDAAGPLLATTRSAGVAAFTPPVLDELDVDGVDYRTTTTVTEVLGTEARRVTVVSKWGITPASLSAACDTSGIRCTTQSLVRTAMAADVDPVTGIAPTDTCVAGAKLICEAYIRSGRVLDGATMASATDTPAQVADVDLFVRTASKATTVSAQWKWLNADGSTNTVITKSLASGADGTRWVYTVPADISGATTTHKGEIRPGTLKVVFNAVMAVGGSAPAVERDAFWSYAVAGGSDAVSASVSDATNWCVSGNPVQFAVVGHSIGFDAGTKSQGAQDTVDVVFTTTDTTTKTVTVAASVIGPVSVQEQVVNGKVISGWVNATWTATPPPTTRCDNRAVTVVVHRAADHTTTPMALRLPSQVVNLPAPSVTLTIDGSGNYVATWVCSGASAFTVERTITGSATVTTSTAADNVSGTLAPGQTLNLRVQGSSGVDVSPWSATSSVTRTSAPVGAITVTRAGDTATFSWAAVPGATSYRIVTAIPPAGALPAVDQAGTSVTLAVDRGMVGYLNVYAGNAGGWSGAAASSVATPLWDPLVMGSGWVNYSSEYTSARYTKTASGAVMLSGLVRSGSTADMTVLGTLPPGDRPSGRLVFGVAAAEVGGTGPLGRIDIEANGQIVLYASTSAAWTSLEGISFLSATAAPTRAALPLTNGWTNYGSWAEASSALDSIGRVWVQGLLVTGNVTYNTVAATFPANQRSSEYLHLPQYASPGFRTMNYKESVFATGEASAWMPIQAMFYAAGKGSWNALVLQNSWTAYAGYSAPAYTKSADGMVTLKGLVHEGVVTPGTVLATLPAGYRPSATVLGRVASSTGFGRVDVLPNGQIITGAGCSAGWIALESISFMAEQ